jgi:hypothetical protein
MKWLRMYTEILDDPKMSKLTDDEYRVFTYLLCMAAEEEREGLIPKSVAEIAWRLRLPTDLIEKTISSLKGLFILKKTVSGVKFINWKKRQFRSDDVTRRVQKHRGKHEKYETLYETLAETLESRAEKRREEQSRENTTLSSSQMTCPQKEIVSLYHQILPELPAVKRWTEERARQLRARWKEDPKHQDLDWWKRYFNHVRESPFLMGNGNKDWTPNLEWLIRKRNLVNVIEGKYHEA